MKSRVTKKTVKKNPVQARNAARFFFETGLLKRVKRSGWWVVGIKDPESVAEHCFRCAVIGYYLAHLEGADPLKVLMMALFNDLHEARINDLHKMGHYYMDFREAEKKAFDDQIAPLDARVGGHMKDVRGEYDAQESLESVVARDADILECLLQAKEYYDQGYPQARTFFKKAPKHLKTDAAAVLWKEIRSADSAEWWKEFTKFER